MTTTKTAEPPKIITLVELCKTLKTSPRDARMLLRLAEKQKGEYPNLVKAHKPRQPWEWETGSKALEEAKKAITAPKVD